MSNDDIISNPLYPHALVDASGRGRARSTIQVGRDDIGTPWNLGDVSVTRDKDRGFETGRYCGLTLYLFCFGFYTFCFLAPAIENSFRYCT